MSAAAPAERWTASARAVIVPWVVTRILVEVGWVVARTTADRLVPGNRPVQLDEGLALWDGAWYHQIAAHGYDASPREALRFFPLYPWIGGLLGGSTIALALVANLAGFAALVLLRRLALVETGSTAIAHRSVLLLSLFPAAGALVWTYAEPLFLAAAIGTWLAARTGRWWWAALAGVAAGACRPVGILLAAAVLVEVVTASRPVSRRGLVERLAAVVGPVVGLGIALAHSAVVDGSWLAPVRIQEPLRGGWAEPITRTIRAVADLFGSEQLADGLHAPFAVGFIMLVVIGARRLPLGATVYAALVVLVALAADNLNSLERYGMAAFPLAIVGARLLEHRRRWEPYVYAASAAGLVGLTSMAWTGAYVP